MKNFITKLLLFCLLATLIPVNLFTIPVVSAEANFEAEAIETEGVPLELAENDFDRSGFGHSPLHVDLVPEETGTTAENVVGFQLSFNKAITSTPLVEDFIVINGLVSEVISFNNNNRDFWVLVSPDANDVDIQLTLKADVVEDFHSNFNPETGPVEINYFNSPFSGLGSGTEQSPYLISSCAQLQEMQKDLDAYYRLAEDIDCLESQFWNFNPTEFEGENLIPDELDGVINNGYRGFNPVGNSLSPFTGELDGNGKEISDLWIFRKYNNNVGLFGYAEDAYIHNLEVVGSNIVGSENTGTIFGYGEDVEIDNVDVFDSTTRAYRNYYGGGLVGQLTEDSGTSEITNSSYTGSVHGTGNVIGGIVGRMTGGSIYFTEATVEVDGGYGIGGFVGEMTGGQISSSEVTGDLTLQRDDVYNKLGFSAGGFVGLASGQSQIIGSRADVNLEIEGEDAAASQSRMGGFVGNMYDNASISYSSGHGDVIGDTGQVGGFVGYSSSGSGIERSYATGNVTGLEEVGGFAGNLSSSFLRDVYATGNVTGLAGSIGGLVGYSSLSAINNTYSTGNVIGLDDVGGLVGTMQGGSLEHSFSVSSITSAGMFVGALIGNVDLEASTLNYNYFVPTSSIVNECYGGGIDQDGCIGLEASNTYFYDEGNLPFSLSGDNIWNKPDSDILIWDFEADAYPVLFPVLPVLESLQVDTEVVTNITQNSATLKATITSGEANAYGFFWGTTSHEDGAIPNDLLSLDILFATLLELYESTDGTVEEENEEAPFVYELAIQDLSCGTTYYFRPLVFRVALIDYFGGLFEDVNIGSEASFTTLACDTVSVNSSGSTSGSRNSKWKNAIIQNSVESTSLTYSEEVKLAMSKGIFTKDPESNTNKCEALTMMSRVFDWQVPTATSSKYTDVPEWCLSVAAYGTDRGIVEGRTSTTLGMETPVTRDEIALMIYRELKLQKYEFGDFSNVKFAGFSDTLTPWAEEAVMVLYKEGIIKGFPNADSPQTVFGGERNILKQDLGVMLLRI